MTTLVDRIEPWAPERSRFTRLVEREPRLSERYPVLFPLAVRLHRARRRVEWMRSEHSFDPFPDNARVLPWGTGCSIVYNYVDLQVRNDTTSLFQLRIRVGEEDLEGELRADRAQDRL